MIWNAIPTTGQWKVKYKTSKGAGPFAPVAGWLFNQETQELVPLVLVPSQAKAVPIERFAQLVEAIEYKVVAEWQV